MGPREEIRLPVQKPSADQSDSVIYSIYNSVSGRFRWRRDGQSTVWAISEHTGGRVFALDREIDFHSISNQISRELRSQYSLGYKYTNTARAMANTAGYE